MTAVFVVASVLTAVCAAGAMTALFSLHGAVLDVARELRALVGEVAVAREPDMAVADAAGVTVAGTFTGVDPERVEAVAAEAMRSVEGASVQ